MTKPPLHCCRGGFVCDSLFHSAQLHKALHERKELSQLFLAFSIPHTMQDIPRQKAKSLDQSTRKLFTLLQLRPFLLVVACRSKLLHFFFHIFTSYGMTKKWLLSTIAGAAVHQLNIL